MYRIRLSSCLLLVALMGLGPRCGGQDTPQDKLASRLVEAKTDAERNSILGQEKEALTPEVVQAVIRRGWGLRAKGQMDQAENDFRVARDLAERIQDRAGVSDALLNIGIVHDIKGDHEGAVSYFRQSLAVAKELGDKTRMARSWMNLGIAYGGTGDWKEQLSAYSKAQEIAESIPDPETIAKTASNLGELYRVNGDFEKSVAHFQKAVDIFQSGQVSESRGRDPSGLAKALRGIGAVALAQGNYSLAHDYLLRSVKSLARSEDQSFLLVLYNDLGEVYEYQGDYPQALAFYRKGLALSEQRAAQQNKAQFLQGIGIVEETTGQYKEASAHLRESLALSKKSNCQECEGSLWMNLGQLEDDQGHTQAAVEAWQKGLSLSESAGVPQNTGQALAALAKLDIKQGKFEEALAYSERAIKAAKQQNLQETLWMGQESSGLALQGLGKTEQARASFDQAISTIEQLRSQVAGGEEQQQSFFAERYGPYQDMVELLIAQNQTADAFAYAERAKGRSLLDVLQSGRRNLTKSMTPEEREKEQQLQSEMVALNRQMEKETGEEKPDEARVNGLKSRIEAARLQYADFQTNLYASHPELRTRRGQIQPVKLQEAAGLLPDSKSAFLQFVTGEKKSYLFVLTKREGGASSEPELRVYPIASTEKEMKKRAEHFREQLGRRDLAFKTSSRNLYRTLIEPAKSQLAGKDALVIVPDGPLWNLPFQALQGENGRYLLEEVAISYAPSLTVLREMVKVRQKSAPAPAQAPVLLAMADPVLRQRTLQQAALVYRDEKLGPLPEARTEALKLKQLYGNQQSKVYTGAAAGEDRFKAEAGQFRVLHLATHGIFNDASPMYSHVLLSTGGKDSKEDGLLEAWEIMQMDLNADLAVLSACETARGRVSAGEGVIGLTWAFLVAGVPTTVVSEWKVESTSTSNLMLAFHRALKANSAKGSSAFSTARALQRSELQLLHNPQYAHPFYWAGFIVVGDPR